jgi:hypothetical protein
VLLSIQNPVIQHYLKEKKKGTLGDLNLDVRCVGEKELVKDKAKRRKYIVSVVFLIPGCVYYYTAQNHWTTANNSQQTLVSAYQIAGHRPSTYNDTESRQHFCPSHPFFRRNGREEPSALHSRFATRPESLLQSPW